MGKPPKPPAAIIIARHGARLDAADENWHLTSPTAYDPPLTYGGWTQARTLGLRVASLLQTPEWWDGSRSSAGGGGSSGAGADTTRRSSVTVAGLSSVSEETRQKLWHTHEGSGSDDRTTSKGQENVKPRKYRVIIHSSPFLRCVQTAIALGSGISQGRGIGSSGSQILSSPLSPVPTMSPTAEEESASASLPSSSSTIIDRRSLLRLDAFLGEWLTPDYFENIAPPPGSSTMLASAKGELLRRGETVNMNTPMRKPSLGHFPGGWNHLSGSSSGSTTPVTTEQQAQEPSPYPAKDEEDPHTHPPELPKHDRYVPPTPSFAISPSDPIPPGYVAHARDACIEVDYQWDSLKAPLDWGTGGEYGEEWSSMHRRFRTGLERMLQWYRHSDEDDKNNNTRSADDDAGDDVETVVVLVTHGAGCNALIGALTKRPALIDVGLASLTVAVRKEEGKITGAENISPPYKASPPNAATVADGVDDYELRLIASSEHLRRHRSNTQQQSAHQSRESSPRRQSVNSISSYRRRLDSAPAPLGPGERDAVVRNSNAKKSQTQPPPPPPQQQQQQRMPYSAISRSMSVNTRSSSPGLWGSSPVSTPDSVDDILPNFEDPRPPYIPSRRNTAAPSAIQEHVAEDTFPGGVTRTATLPTREKSTNRVRSQHGLWRSSSSSRDRESTFTKRRWTMTDQAAP